MTKTFTVKATAADQQHTVVVTASSIDNAKAAARTIVARRAKVDPKRVKLESIA